MCQKFTSSSAKEIYQQERRTTKIIYSNSVRIEFKKFNFPIKEIFNLIKSQITDNPIQYSKK